MTIRAGHVVDDRFEIEQLAGSGGTAEVYRARDLETGETVALKVLQTAGTLALSRFAREANVLSQLRLPGIVRYIAHGVAGTGQLYLAMEWLTGATLSDLLARRPLTVDETLALGLRVSTALGRAHRLGFIHRDLKPSNLLLEGDAVARATLIDFGVARQLGADPPITLPGALLGTPEYMAPEQARGESWVDARADVFALGSVLFECLAGRPAFSGIDPLSALMKVLLEDPPRLREVRADVPAWLDDLVAQMLSKSPGERPRDGAVVAAALAASGESGADEEERASQPPASLPGWITTSERKVVCLLLARDGYAATDATLSEPENDARLRRLRHVVERFQGRLEVLQAQWLLAVLSGASAPTDLAAQAARCALALKAALGSTPAALVTGRAELTARVPMGEVIDRAVRLVPHESDAAHDGAIRIDEVTARLLGARFQTSEDEAGRWLHGVREEVDSGPELLGKPTACVGRDREIALLVREFRHTVEESTAAALLVTGHAGMGKSRLRREFIRALHDRDEDVDIWMGQADPMSAGSTFSLIADALRSAIGLIDGEPLASRRRKVQARVERHPGLDAARVATFLGELVGAPYPDEGDVPLRAARRNPMLMGDQIRLAWEDFIRAECSTRPVLLVLEDLHWGDLATVNMVDAALRNLKDLPFMVLALARPEVHEVFPNLWRTRRGQEVRLTPLTRRAAERLVRQALGRAARDELVSTVVQRADGNAFYLEEQIRAVASGQTEALPETVLAMVQAGLEALDAEARRVLRAASIFGETFLQSGVTALVGGFDVAAKLMELELREVIRRCTVRGSDVEYRFRHAIVRDAAYGMLTDRDRRVGHALAGAHLERAQGADAITLAEHFERGGEPVRAAAAYLQAARQALAGDELGASIQRAERGVACRPDTTTHGLLRAIQASAHRWRAEYDLAEQCAIEAALHLTPGSAAWFNVITEIAQAARQLDARERSVPWMEQACQTDALEGALGAKNICLSFCAFNLCFTGRYALADAMIAAAERALAEPGAYDIEADAALHQARAVRALTGGDPGTCLTQMEAALARFEYAGNHRETCLARMNVGYIYGQIGDFEEAEKALRAACAAAERMGLHDTLNGVLQCLGQVLACRGRLDEAKDVEEASIAAHQRAGDPRMEGAGRVYLATILLLAGDPAAAEREARASEELLRSAPPLRAYAVAVHASILLSLGREEEALSLALDAHALLSSMGAEEGEATVRLVYAEALLANGRAREATAAIAAARDALLARAATIHDSVLRQSFLQNVPENARTLELARQWLTSDRGAPAST